MEKKRKDLAHYRACENECVRLYVEEGDTLAEIAHKLEVSQSWATEVLDLRGVKKRPVGQRQRGRQASGGERKKTPFNQAFPY